MVEDIIPFASHGDLSPIALVVATSIYQLAFDPFTELQQRIDTHVSFSIFMLNEIALMIPSPNFSFNTAFIGAP